MQGRTGCGGRDTHAASCWPPMTGCCRCRGVGDRGVQGAAWHRQVLPVGQQDVYQFMGVQPFRPPPPIPFPQPPPLPLPLLQQLMSTAFGGNANASSAFSLPQQQHSQLMQQVHGLSVQQYQPALRFGAAAAGGTAQGSH
jgi:hypothetical protein